MLNRGACRQRDDCWQSEISSQQPTASSQQPAASQSQMHRHECLQAMDDSERSPAVGPPLGQIYGDDQRQGERLEKALGSGYPPAVSAQSVQKNFHDAGTHKGVVPLAAMQLAALVQLLGLGWMGSRQPRQPAPECGGGADADATAAPRKSNGRRRCSACVCT